MKKPLIESSLILAALALPLLAFAQDFVPLTNLPGLEEVEGASTLPTFLNNLYRLCIGAAAVIAVLQIMRGGAYLMWNKGSITQNQRAKELITNSIFGLILVLSPAIVFGIINPDILDLSLNVTDLQPGDLTEQNLDSYSSEDLRAVCGVHEEFQEVPYRRDSDFESGNACTVLGEGWIKTQSACCRINDASKLCCGYNSNRVEPDAPPDAEDGEGTYRIEYVREDRNYETTNGKCKISGTERYETRESCQERLTDGLSTTRTCGNTTCSTAVRHTCSEQESYVPNESTFNRINALPRCQ